MNTRNWIILSAYLFTLIATNVFTFTQARQSSSFADELPEFLVSEDLESLEEWQRADFEAALDQLELDASTRTRLENTFAAYLKKFSGREALMLQDSERMVQMLEQPKFPRENMRALLQKRHALDLEEQLEGLALSHRLRSMVPADQREAFMREFDWMLSI